MSRVVDKVILITGAASGVGKEDARLLAREGARVVLTDVDEKGVRELAQEIGTAALGLAHDIASDADWNRVIATTCQKFGRLDVLVNNAAILELGSIEDTSLELWKTIQRVNAEGYFLGCKYGVAAMKERGGSIINMSSLAALAGLADFCAYSAAKGAVTALTRSVAAHCRQRGYKIRCNSVHPDGILTPMTARFFANAAPATNSTKAKHDPMARTCLPQDVANLILFLASDESKFINGAQLCIDNGQLSIDS